MSISTMNRPVIYYDVLLALTKQVKNGNLIMDESSDVVDCIFHVNPYPEEDRSDEIKRRTTTIAIVVLITVADTK